MNTQFFNKGLLALKQVSPTALTATGVTGIVVAGVLACRATLKAAPKIKEISDDLELLGSDFTGDAEAAKFVAREKAKVIGSGAGELVKLYAIPVTLGVVSIIAIVGGHRVMLKRNAALASALTLTEQAFKKYRKAVVEAIGEEKERELRYSTEIERIDDTKAGKVLEIATETPNGMSPYARCFDETNSLWEPNAQYNLVLLSAQQKWANKRLHAKGFLLLNDVYKSLGFEETSAGALVGWAIGHGGDEFVDFGVFDTNDERKRSFLNGEELAVWLDFNVDGAVWDLIGRARA